MLIIPVEKGKEISAPLSPSILIFHILPQRRKQQDVQNMLSFGNVS